MKVQFIGQACVLITTSDCRILCDPWLFGTAFNDSWRHFPDPWWSNSLYDEITHLWISHEHPDHFHIPTLKSMPAAFKEKVTLLFQRNNSDKMPSAFRTLGFINIVLTPHRKKIPLTAKTTVYNHQIGQMDSALAVMEAGQLVLNLNDCEANSSDCKRLKKDLGKVDVVINQFSMAGYNGRIDYRAELPAAGARIVKNMMENHVDLGVEASIPFASNIYFCCEDNRHINEFSNTPASVYHEFKKAGLNLEVLYVGDVYDLDTRRSNTAAALAKYEELYKTRPNLKYYKPDVVPLAELEKAFKARSKQLHDKYPGVVLSRLKPLLISVPDLGIKARLCLNSGEFTVLDPSADHDLIVNSQPLHFAFQHPWGVQTLGVSARSLVKSNEKRWIWYRIITSLNNAEIYLKPRYLLTPRNLKYMYERFAGGAGQILYQIRRMTR